MKNLTKISLLAVLAVVSSKPIHEEGIVEVSSNSQGEYKYSFNSENITIVEERDLDGEVKGVYSYVDEYGERQGVEYSAGIGGFRAFGSIVPISGPSPVVELPEVQEATHQHLKIVAEVRSLLPELKLNEDVVEEKSVVPLSREEHLAAIEAVLKPQYLNFAEETPEIEEVKEKLFEAYVKALAA